MENNELQAENTARPEFLIRLKLLWGATRRMYLHYLRPGYVAKQLEERCGECNRCGVCCQLVSACSFYEEDNCQASCKLYGKYRLPNCRNFPINEADIADRDLISTQTSCGFWWKPTDKR